MDKFALSRLKHKMREWERYQVRRDIFPSESIERQEASEGIERIKQELQAIGFEIGHSDFGRLQLTLID